ncbi:MAG TPA: hypothetical protein GXZ78_08205 [Eubacteriaceae bacterium]|nr:hypothetical protein [Eubacteriaceae bacterium]
MKRNIIIRIVSGILALTLIAGLLFVAGAFIGNPISLLIANRAAKDYVQENYAFLDLELEKAKYDFKTSNYWIRAISKTSKDTKFSIYYSNGKIIRDDYKSNVLSGFNTLYRLSQEYSLLAKDILNEELGYKNINISVIYGKEKYENTSDIVKLDMDFDRTLPLDPQIIIDIDLEDNSLEKISEILIDIHKVFLTNNCVFKEYSLYSENNKGKIVNINGVKPEDIESGELLQILIEAKDWEDKEKKEIQEKIDQGEAIERYERDSSQNGISIFIKE